VLGRALSAVGDNEIVAMDEDHQNVLIFGLVQGVRLRERAGSETERERERRE